MAQESKEELYERAENEEMQEPLNLGHHSKTSPRFSKQVKQNSTYEKERDNHKSLELSSTDQEKAQANQKQFNEAIHQNKEKNSGAVAIAPSLMERFNLKIQRDKHRKRAIQNIVSNVFRNNLKVLKEVKIFNDEEMEIAKKFIENNREKCNK